MKREIIREFTEKYRNKYARLQLHESARKGVTIQRSIKMVKMNQDGLRRIWQMIREIDEKAANSELERDEIAEQYGKKASMLLAH